jgi:alkaline phosphatase
VLSSACAALLSAPLAAHAEDKHSWYHQGDKALKAAEKHSKAHKSAARNVILFVGDGMGISTVTAARILSGQLQGKPGEESSLAFEDFPNVALVKTYSINQQTSDSAPTMTAMVTGVKTKDGILSIDKNVVRGDHATVAGNELTTILELAEKKHLSTGVVSTARITHATPAACYAHSPDRDWEADSNIPEEARAAGAKDIARQLIEFPGDGLEVALGGGRSYFLPETQADPEMRARPACAWTAEI